MIEILHTRDPDGSCDFTVFVDGEPTEAFNVEDVDPGRGYTREDWDESTEWVLTKNDDYSPAFRDAVIDARNEAAKSPYVTED